MASPADLVGASVSGDYKHPPGTLARSVEELREALLDLSYQLLRVFGIIWLARRFGLTLRPWVQERYDREWGTKPERGDGT